MYMYYYPAIPHHHLRALLKACECQEEARSSVIYFITFHWRQCHISLTWLFAQTVLVMFDNAEFGAATIGLIVTLNGIYWSDGNAGAPRRVVNSDEMIVH